jgi:PAS domain S-box-containing protein
MAFDDDLPLMLWTARPDMSCEQVSRAWLDFTGFSFEQALGDGWARAVHPEDLARWLDTCVRAFDAREPYEIEYRLRRGDGKYRWIVDRGVPRYSREGAFAGYAGCCLDIDERRRDQGEMARALERERKLRVATEAASRLKDGFVASALRELQAPVQAIATWVSNLRREAAPAKEAAHILDGIERNARRLESDTPLLSGVRVLVVDDDPSAREAMAKVLRIAGAETRTAASTADALQGIGAWRPDVVMTDLGIAKPVEPVALLAAVARLAQPSGV